MYRTLTIHAFDLMDTVHITTRLKTYPELGPGADSTVLERITSVQSVGEPEDHEWLRDCLVALLEDL